MFVTATEMKNSFGKYLELCRKENIIVTKNGKKQAVLLSCLRDVLGYEAGEPVPQYGTSPRKPGLITYRQFLMLAEKSDQRYELIDGDVYMLPSPAYSHQDILGILFIQFWEYFKTRERCRPVLSPFDIELTRESIKEMRDITEDDINIVQPDLTVLCDVDKNLTENGKYKGIPELVVEILSPSTRSKDIMKKGNLYEDSGIREYWIVDDKHEEITVYQFSEFAVVDNRSFHSGETIQSFTYPGLSVEVKTLFSQVH